MCMLKVMTSRFYDLILTDLLVYQWDTELCLFVRITKIGSIFGVVPEKSDGEREHCSG